MKLKKSIRSITTIILICATLIPAFGVFASANTAGNSFTDVKQNAWYYSSVYYCQVQGYINGVGGNCFDPHGSITREQFVMILANIKNANYDLYKYIPSGMDDVPTDKWYSGAITWAVKQGYVSGISENTFGLGKAINRASLVTLLYRLAQKEGDVIDKKADLTKYSDYHKVQPWMKESLEWAVGNSIITSTASTELILDPYGTATRAQTAVILKAYDMSKLSNTVGANREALKNQILYTHGDPKPKLTQLERPTFDSYIRKTDKPAPERCKYIYDWFIGIILDQASQSTGQSFELKFNDPDDLDIFSRFMEECISWPYSCRIRTNADGKPVSILLTGNEIYDLTYRSYEAYISDIDSTNSYYAEEYKAAMEQYEDYVKKADRICDTVEAAVIASGALGKPEKEAINLVIDYMCKSCTYNYAALEDYSLDAWSVNSCLNLGSAVCDGYAKTFYAMCLYLGLDVEYCRGVTDTGEGHAWNKVTVNGNVYYFDVTWHDCLNNASYSSNKYVWAKENTFSKDHIYQSSHFCEW
ncbi:MAG: S-layer homology domain-containing protein [Clostridia bacterium]|nr:S-layer homology domain-containing protein [Clostridia bacterium]